MEFGQTVSWSPDALSRLKSALKNSKRNFDAEQSLRKAGVLLPLYVQQNDLTAVYIRRTRHFLRDGREAVHSGQIAFPGGKIEAGETVRQAALREAEEEIGLSPQKVEVLDTLGVFETLTSNIASTVFVGWLHEKPTLKRDHREVAAIYHIPLKEIWPQHRNDLDLSILQHKIALHYHWQPSDELRPICIWGMTSRVTWQLFSILQHLG